MSRQSQSSHFFFWIIFITSLLHITTAYDLDVARTICAVGRRRGVSARVMLAAFETAIVESGCRNLNHGDRDSVGIFQQRPSQGWGTREQCMNVDYAANKFFDVARTRDICGPSVGNLAQCVQRSGFPHRYDQNEGNARSLMAQIGCSGEGGGGDVGGGTKNEAPCSSVGHCYNKGSEKCAGTPRDKVNGQFACPTQSNDVICCDTSSSGGGGGTRNENPCSEVGHCYNRDSEKCDGSPQGKVNGQFACPTQADNIICCVKNEGGSSGTKNEFPCSSVGHCYNRNTESCSGVPQDKVGGQFACPTQSNDVICCDTSSGGGSGTRNESPCSDVGHCYNRDTEGCDGSPQGKVNGQFACPTQGDNIICCVKNGGGSSGTKNESPCSSVGHCYNKNTETCSGVPQDKVGGQFACPSQPNDVICCDTSGGGGGTGTRNEHPCSDVGHCYNRDIEGCDGSPQGKVNGQFACPTQPDNIICCVKNGAGAGNGIKNEHPCNTVGQCYDRNTGSCPTERQTTKVDGHFACPTQPDNIICCRN